MNSWATSNLYPTFLRTGEGREPYSRGQRDSALRASPVLAVLGISDFRSQICNPVGQVPTASGLTALAGR
jgi:hypothetical protein